MANVQLCVEKHSVADCSVWELDRTFGWTDGEPTCVAFSPDGSVVAVGLGSHASLLMAWFLWNPAETTIVQLWNVRTGDSKIRIADPSNRARAMAFYPEGTSLALVDRKQISVFNAETG